ncbi:unnamed protein product [Spirodela intermedia]|uniref:Prephenate dehydratase domain-containing protein n=1 Tax=Spirodela intermedia TaxID=51605 RepID=A0A7I8JFB8_SPIIN|nr:unnamed protein product [Spirodela intermedia]CAA6668837.1 unnamed protein product [Spirodela intermedia]
MPTLFPGGAAVDGPAASSSSCSCQIRCGPQRRKSPVGATASPKTPEKTKTTTTKPATASPLRSAEELAFRLGLDLAVAGLERLFSATTAGGDGGAAALLDPSSGRPLRVAYQGDRGSYCQEAATATFSGFPGPSPPSPLESGAADRAVVPAENSLDGPVHRNFDLLLRHPLVEIAGELVLPVNHCLLVLPSAAGAGAAVRRVASHPQALAHCAARLAALGVETEEVPSAAAAARALADGRLPAERRTSRRAPPAPRPEVTSPASSSSSSGRWRRLGSTATSPPAEEEEGDCGVRAGEGSVGAVQGDLGLREPGLSVTRVDHRPNRSNPVRVVDRPGGPVGSYDYVFILDVESAAAAAGSTRLDSALDAIVNQLTEICCFVRVVGAYAI